MDELTTAPALGPVQTRPLFDIRLTAGPPALVGAVPAGDRRAVAITGGSFHGDRLAGTVVSGIDWQTGRANGSLGIDVKAILRLDSGGLIALRYAGLRAGPPAVMAALARGEEVNFNAYYFRVEASFETSEPNLAWLNDIVAIGIGHRYPTGPLYSFYELL